MEWGREDGVEELNGWDSMTVAWQMMVLTLVGGGNHGWDMGWPRTRQCNARAD